MGVGTQSHSKLEQLKGRRAFIKAMKMKTLEKPTQRKSTSKNNVTDLQQKDKYDHPIVE